MKIFTFQTALWRQVDQCNVPRIDISWKIGEKLFAPEPDLLFAYKRGEVDEATYSRRYREILQQRFDQNPIPFLKLSAYDTVAFNCFCSGAGFCHRFLFVEFLTQLFHTEYIGEISKEGIIPGFVEHGHFIPTHRL